MNQTVEPFNLHSCHSYQSIEAEICALQSYREFFFEIHLSFRVLHYLSEKCILA